MSDTTGSPAPMTGAAASSAAAAPATLAPVPEKPKFDDGGVVAIAAADHKEAASLFAELKATVLKGVGVLEEDFEAIAAKLHL